MFFVAVTLCRFPFVIFTLSLMLSLCRFFFFSLYIFFGVIPVPVWIFSETYHFEWEHVIPPQKHVISKERHVISEWEYLLFRMDKCKLQMETYIYERKHVIPKRICVISKRKQVTLYRKHAISNGNMQSCNSNM